MEYPSCRFLIRADNFRAAGQQGPDIQGIKSGPYKMGDQVLVMRLRHPLAADLRDQDSEQVEERAQYETKRQEIFALLGHCSLLPGLPHADFSNSALQTTHQWFSSVVSRAQFDQPVLTNTGPCRVLYPA